jgi:hypothetical protein
LPASKLSAGDEDSRIRRSVTASLKPASARDKWWLDQAMTLAGKIGDTRWLLTQQA